MSTLGHIHRSRRPADSSTPAAPGIHVIPGRRGSWSVIAEGAAGTVSVHSSTTQAELAARQLARRRGARHVIVHDRYCRLYSVPVDGAPKGI
jgi:hypothetical protein